MLQANTSLESSCVRLSNARCDASNQSFQSGYVLGKRKHAKLRRFQKWVPERAFWDGILRFPACFPGFSDIFCVLGASQRILHFGKGFFFAHSTRVSAWNIPCFQCMSFKRRRNVAARYRVDQDHNVIACCQRSSRLQWNVAIMLNRELSTIIQHLGKLELQHG